MSYSQRVNSPSSRLFYNQQQPKHQFYTRTYYSLDDDESQQLEPRVSTSVKKCSVGTSTSGGYLSQRQISPHYRETSLSPQPSTSLHHYSPRLTTIEDDSLGQHHNSPLSDALLLALRRSRPNTRLFRALFQYIPLRDSPNENPHLELPLNVGEILLVHGQMDDDQFYFAETLSGRVGLLPSNFVEQIPDYVLLQNASRAPSPSNVGTTCANVGSTACCSSTLPRNPITSSVQSASYTPGPVYGTSGHRQTPKPSISFATRQDDPAQAVVDSFFANGTAPPSTTTHIFPNILTQSRPASPSFTLNVPPHHTQITHDFTDLDNKNAPLPDSVCPYPPVDVSKIKVQEIKNLDKPRVPFPHELTVEKKLSRSVILSWLPPEDQLTVVSQYHVCVDGVVKAVVPGTYKCKALIEDLNLDRSVNVSVRALTENGHSPDAACTLAIGAEASVAPQHVRVTNITPVSSCISWYPSNSNAEHVILLNAIKIGVCPPAVFQVQLLDLVPSTIYRVSVRTKHPKAVLEQRAVERCLDFKTLPKIGLPDPPLSVQAEVGPQPGTLLISWRPVTTQPKPPSRAAVQSYLIFADGRNIAQVPSSTADHILLRLADFADDPPIFITVRTKTKEGAVSADSNVVRVPRAGAGINSNLFSGASTSALNNLAEALKFTNALSNAPLATASLPASLIGLPGVDLDGNQLSSMSMPPNIVPAAGLLTTVPPNQQVSQPAANNPLNTAYPLNQAAVYFPQQASNSLAGQLAQQNSAIYTTAAQLNALQKMWGHQDLQYQQQQVGNRRISESLYEPQAPLIHPMHPTQHPHKFLGRSSTTALLHNGTTSIPKYPSVLNWKQQTQPPFQYYTFHPKALYKEFKTDEQPSVLEMENNYLLKHRQQQQRVPYDSSAVRYDYYGRPTRQGPATVVPGSRRTTSGTGPAAFAQPRIARVRSDEFLGTRSEPDLRPLPIYLDDENCRWFVALYDYNHHMSPNPNAQQEELSFFKHQLIKIQGNVDPDGFYRGQIGRRYGLVPSNMVIEIAKDDLVPTTSSRRLPPNEPDYPTGSSIADSTARRMRWGSMKSRSYDVAERRPAYYAGQPADNYSSSLDRRDTSQQYSGGQSRYYDSVDGYPPNSTTIRAGAYAPRYPSTRGEVRGSYERSSSYDPRVATARPDYYPPRQNLRRGEPGWEYSTDHRDARDIREGAATIRSGERYNEAQIAARYGTMPRQMPSDYARASYDRTAGPLTGGAPGYAKGEQYQSDQVPQQPYGQNAPPPLQQQMSQTSQGQQMSQSDGYAPPQMNVPQMQQNQQQQPPGMSQMSQQQIAIQQGQIQQQQQIPDDRLNRTTTDMLPTKQMIAKYDYDSRQLSPNVDAEQIELSFRMNDVITIFGEMDEDGFYVGELNGVRGLVPSNFLQEVPGNTLMASNAIPLSQQQQQPVHKTSNAVGVMAGPTGAYGPTSGMEQQTRPKGVMFSDIAKPPPIRQTSQTSSKTGMPMGSAMSSAMAAPKPKASTASAPSKPVVKKATDPGGKASAANASRKPSQAAKKDAVKKKA